MLKTSARIQALADQRNRNGRRHISSSQGLLEAAIPRATAQSSWDSSRPPRAMTRATGQAEDVRTDPSACRPEQPEWQAAPQQQPRAPRSSDSQSHGPEQLGQLATAASHDQSDRSGRRRPRRPSGLPTRATGTAGGTSAAAKSSSKQRCPEPRPRVAGTARDRREP